MDLQCPCLDALQDGDEGDEDEDDAWVRQQLQKAGAASFARAPQQPSGGGASSRDSDMARVPAHARATADPLAQAAAAGQSVMVSLQEGLRRLQEKRQHVERQQKQTRANLADSLQVGDEAIESMHQAAWLCCLEHLLAGALAEAQHLRPLRHALQAITQLESDVAAASQKYTYLQETRGFVADMCDMLQVRS